MDRELYFSKVFREFSKRKINTSGYSDDHNKVIYNIQRWIDKNKVSSFAELDEYIYETSARKETAARIITSFSNYCLAIGEHFGETSLTSICIVDDPTRRSIEIVKYLHERRSIHEVTEHFAISERTVRRIINQLYYGISFMGCFFNARVLKSKARYILQTFIHPFFIGLDRAELISFLAIMEREEQDPLYGVFIRRIKGQITRQLTDTAKEFAKNLSNDEIIQNAEEFDEKETSIAVRDALILMLHTGTPGNITVYIGDEDRELYNCKISSYDYRTGKITIAMEDSSEVQTDVASISMTTLLNQP